MISKRQILENMKKFVGKDILLLKPHKLAGQKGKTTGTKMVGNKPSLIVKLDDSTETTVSDNKQMFFILYQINDPLDN